MQSPNSSVTKFYHIGFTGSRHPITPRAKISLHLTLIDLYVESKFSSAPRCFHHGDCVNADETAAMIAHGAGYLVHAHPPFDDKLRAFSEFNDVIHAPKDYIERNHDIVDVSRIMIATPLTMNEVNRSGTWATIRYARQLNRELCIIFPDGTIKWENSANPNGRTAT